MCILSSCILCIWVSCIIFCNSIEADKKYFLKTESNQLPQTYPCRKDLSDYLNSLERIINFAYTFREDYDISYSFGLFLANVNLKPFTVDGRVPVSLGNHIKRLLRKSDRTLDFFNLKRGSYVKNDVNYKIYTFFKNYTSWSNWLHKLNFGLPGRKGRLSDHSEEFWKVYVHQVDDIDKWEPSPQQSDLCLASLADTEENLSKHLQKCNLSINCYNTLLTGTNFGYALTHRLLLLLFGRFGRGCTVFSKTRDQMMRRSFCNIIYNEVEYIAYNRYRHVDLMFEQIAFCSLNGHAEFLRQTWLFNLLRYQTTQGCFGQHLPSFRQHLSTFSQPDQKDSEEVNWKYDVMNGTCNSHVTAVAAASIAAAVRFILENE